VAERDTEVVGVVAFGPAEDEPIVWEIALLATRSDCRRHQIGLDLFETALLTLSLKGASSATFEVHKFNRPMIRLLEEKFHCPLFDSDEDPEFFQGAIPLAPPEPEPGDRSC